MVNSCNCIRNNYRPKSGFPFKCAAANRHDGMPIQLIRYHNGRGRTVVLCDCCVSVVIRRVAEQLNRVAIRVIAETTAARPAGSRIARQAGS